MPRFTLRVTGLALAFCVVVGCAAPTVGPSSAGTSSPELSPPAPAITVTIWVTPSTTASGPPINSAGPTPTARPETVVELIDVPDVVGMDLQLAQDTAQSKGLFVLTSHDATGQGRLQVLDRNWKVCTQTPSAGRDVPPETVLDFGAVKLDERCP